MMKFKSIDRKKKFEEVLDQVGHLLLTGELTVNQKLPNEIELANSMGISRSSLREAFIILSMLGIIEGKSGEGTVIRQSTPENLKQIMSLVAISRGLDTNELIEARILLETSAARLAAKRRNENDIKKMNQILLELDQHYIDQNEEAAILSDFLFHQSIVQASQNGMIVMLVEVISNLLREQIRHTRSELITSRNVLKRFNEEHWGIFKAIESGDSSRAQHLMEYHLESAQKELGLL